ncbi:ribonuclease [Ensifer sp. 1H6]|nr:YihY/virulence factor BrkB family protein [Ensifer sp. 1H6]OMQ31061.1 ribonuclease [Ensifer sp. 1H6]
MTTKRAANDPRGRDAKSPGQIPAEGLWDVAWRVYVSFTEDRVAMIAAGVTYYLLLAIFPALGIFVSLYAIAADPADISRQIEFLVYVVPSAALRLILDQLGTLASQRPGTAGLGLLVSSSVALWSAHNGIAAIFEAMNIAYGENEKRGFLHRTGLAMVFTVSGMIASILAILAVAVLPAWLGFIGLEHWAELLVYIARWPLLLLLFTGGAAMLYRFGPSREPAKSRWFTWGAAFTTFMWLVTSVLFSFYLDHFANYNATYGTLGAFVGFMVWVWISVIILILGAEINAELEHQTMCDSTTGSPLPMGDRGAYVADTLGEPAPPSSE